MANIVDIMRILSATFRGQYPTVLGHSWEEIEKMIDAVPVHDPSSHEDPKELWLHVKTGCHYKILHHGLNEKDLKPVVIYQAYDGTGPVWVRMAEEFFDGRFRNWE